MHSFSRLCLHLSQAAANQKERILSDYVKSIDEESLAHTFHLLLENRPERCITSATLRQWVLEESGIPEWLLEESIEMIGDPAAALAMVISDSTIPDPISLPQVMQVVQNLKTETPENQKIIIAELWKRMDAEQRLVFNKLLTGTFRYTIRPVEAAKAIEPITTKPLSELIQAFSQKWEIHEWPNIVEQANDSNFAPYYVPFRPVSEIISDPEQLGNPSDWLALFTFQGIHVQARVLKKGIQLWTRNEELLPDFFPEVRNAASYFEEGTLLIADLIVQPADDETPGFFSNLIKRIQSKKMRHDLMERSPVKLVVQDMLFEGKKDIRNLPLVDRRKRLKVRLKKANDYEFQFAPAIEFKSWDDIRQCQTQIREKLADGISLQKLHAPWDAQALFKLKAAPFEIKAVLLYVSKIPDKNKKIITECGFGVWRENASGQPEIISITRSNEGLSPEQIQQLDAWVKLHTRERFGPVRSVDAELVFQLQFDEIQTSRRHKSGLVLHNVRMKMPLEPLSIQQAGTWEQLNALLS